MGIEEKLGKIELPSMPQVVAKIIQIDENNIDVSSDQLETIIAVDPALSSKILKIANSAFYARANKVSSLSQAITLLGFKTIKSLTLLVSASGMFPKKTSSIQVQKEIWMRSVLNALIGKMIAEKTKERGQKDDVFMGALLKNIGQLYLNNYYHEDYHTLYESASNGIDQTQLRKLEAEKFEFDASQLSVYIMENWNFPQELVQISHITQFEEGFSELDELSKRVVVGELIVVLNNLSGGITLNDSQRELYLSLYNDYSTSIEMSEKDREYFLSEEFVSEIHRDEFYTFCEELFSM